MIGQRALDDPRNSLVMDFVRIVSELDSDYFVFENVKGLTVGRHRRFLEELIEAFDHRGYELRLPWQVLNASAYGVPQNRKRLFLMGAKRGLNLPVYPPAQCTGADSAPMIDLPVGPNCKDAIHDIPDADNYRALMDRDEAKITSWGKPSPYAQEMRCMTPDAWHFSYPRQWNPSILTSSARTAHSDISQRRFSETKPGTVEPISRFFKLAPDRISNTLRAGTDSARGAFTSPRPIHYAHPRCITVREMARLHGFPDWFRFHHTKWHGARQIGNSVPPPLARAVASTLIEAMGITPHRPEQILMLNSPSLLTMDMSTAASHFQIEVPIQRRDRKSGVRKRTQLQTERARLAELETSQR